MTNEEFQQKLKAMPKQESMPKATDIQIGGNHYKSMVIQPVEFILKNNIGFCEGSIIKYVSRYKNKNGVEDLKKAKHFLDLLISNIEENEKKGGQGDIK